MYKPSSCVNQVSCPGLAGRHPRHDLAVGACVVARDIFSGSAQLADGLKHIVARKSGQLAFEYLSLRRPPEYFLMRQHEPGVARRHWLHLATARVAREP